MESRFSPLLRNPYLLLTLTALFWSGNMVLGRGLREDLPPMALAFWRWALALGCVLPLALPQWKAHWPSLKAHWRPVLVLGLLGVGGYNTLAYVALQFTHATNAVLLNSFIPIATMALSWLVLRQPLSPIQSVGLVVSLWGVLTIVAQGSLSTLASFNLNTGDLWMLGAVLVWACYTIGLAWRPADVPPMVLLAAFIGVGLLAIAPLYAAEIWLGGRSIRWSMSSVMGIAYVGFFPSFLGYVFYNRGVAEVGANVASLFIHLMPVFGTVLAVIFLGERPHPYHLMGILLILGGIWLSTRPSGPRSGHDPST